MRAPDKFSCKTIEQDTSWFWSITERFKEGLHCLVLQEGEDGKLHPVAYGRCFLTKSERNYHSGKMEFLGLKWAMTDHFKEYLMYKPFVE